MPRCSCSGSRGFNDRDRTFERIDRLLSSLDRNDIAIVGGTADGADRIAAT